MIKNVCIVTDYYPPHIGGQEILFQSIAEGIAAKGINCFVITTKSFPSDQDVESELNLTIIRISVPYFLPRFWFAFLALPKILSLRKNIDIIHGTSYGGVLPVFFAAKLLKKKSVITIHEFMGEKWKLFESNPFSAWFYSTAETLIAKMPFDKFIAVSNYTQLQLKSYGINDDRINLIYNGSNDDVLTIKLDNSFFREGIGFNENDFIFLACGRAGLTKGIQYFIEAVPEIIKNIENAKFIFILTKADKRIWQRIMTGLKKLDENKFKLFSQLERKELIRYLHLSDCIVIPSLSEGFGFNVVEASLLNKKIVATNTGSIPEVISGCHILVEPGSPAALVEGCIKAYNNDLQYAKPKNFSWDIAIDKYIKIYSELFNNQQE